MFLAAADPVAHVTDLILIGTKEHPILTTHMVMLIIAGLLTWLIMRKAAQQGAEIGFSLIPRFLWAVPGLYKGVNPGALGLRNLPFNGGLVSGIVRLGGCVNGLAGGPGILVEPGVVKSQHQGPILGRGRRHS
jgi:hypothetical protein